MEITDNLIELLIQIVHRIGVRAERKVEKEILNDLRKVSNKYGILFNMAQSAINNPDGVIRDVIFPVVNEQTLRDLIKEFKHTGPAYREKIHTIIRASYGSHYRRMVPEILGILEFRSNNEVHRPVIRALELVKKYSDTGHHYLPMSEEIPVDGVIRTVNKEIIVEKDEKGQERINRMNYEISVLQALREKLRCKEIWVVGAKRYRNPDDDLPTDFEDRREENYKALKQPLDAEAFIATLIASHERRIGKTRYRTPEEPQGSDHGEREWMDQLVSVRTTSRTGQFITYKSRDASALADDEPIGYFERSRSSSWIYGKIQDRCCS